MNGREPLKGDGAGSLHFTEGAEKCIYFDDNDGETKKLKKRKKGRVRTELDSGNIRRLMGIIVFLMGVKKRGMGKDASVKIGV